MRPNDTFLAEFMTRVDMRLFTPSLYQYLKDFLEIEKVRPYRDQFVINTFIPPFPGKPFTRFLETYFGPNGRTLIQSVDLAVTNACMFNCWHCYNAGRPIRDLPTDVLKNIVARVQDLGAIVVNFTGGEPCLRHDLVEVCSALCEDSAGILATTGYNFTDELAARLRDTGVYSVSISLDSADEAEHDRRRGVKGAYQIALRGIETAKKWGFYTYTCAVPSKKLLEEENFRRLVELNEQLGVDELQIIEPAPAGRIAHAKLDFGEPEVARIFQYMAEYNRRDGGTAISSFAHMESPECFGCGAAHSHIYIDGTGEVSPCNMLPVSYGNAAEEDLAEIIGRMQQAIPQPCRNCLAYTLRDFFGRHAGRARPAAHTAIPPLPVPADDGLPRFFAILEQRKTEAAGAPEIIQGYNQASATYEDYWLTVASAPIDRLFEQLEIPAGAHALDCGSGTGYSTIKLAQRVGPAGRVIGIDLTPGMIAAARERVSRFGLANVEFRNADVLAELEQMPASSVDVAVSTWLIGYVGCREMFPLVRRVLRPRGVIGFVAHLDRSPVVPIEVFEEIIREQPDALMKAVPLKFPKDERETAEHLRAAGLEITWLRRGTFSVSCRSGREVYDHVMKSGAGTTFYYSLRPDARERLAEEFIRRVENRFCGMPEITIVHEYISGVARRPGGGV